MTRLELSSHHMCGLRSRAASPLIIILPIGIFSWVEALACDSFLIHVGGHVWYDAIIPISLTAYFFYVKGLQTTGGRKINGE